MTTNDATNSDGTMNDIRRVAVTLLVTVATAAFGCAPSRLTLVPVDRQSGGLRPRAYARPWDADGWRGGDGPYLPWRGGGFDATDLHDDDDVYEVSAPGYEKVYVRIRPGGVDLVSYRIQFLRQLAHFPFPTTRNDYVVQQAIDCEDGAQVRLPLSWTILMPTDDRLGLSLLYLAWHLL